MTQVSRPECAPPNWGPPLCLASRMACPLILKTVERSAVKSTQGNPIVKTILVIEDEPEMRRNLTTILRLEKFRPLAAENGRVGIELARREKPDLILCDVMMPELDGYGVLQALRADPSS